jgi:hypothetical protein
MMEPRSARSSGRQLYQLARDGFLEGRAYQPDGSFEDLGPRLQQKASGARDDA